MASANNQKVYQALENARIYHWEFADELGISVDTWHRKKRKPFSDEETAFYLKTIENMVKVR